MRLKETSIYSQILLNEAAGVPKVHQVLRVGKFKHPQYGSFEITTQTLSEMVANFDSKVRGVELAWDYFHESDKEAAAWVNRLELRENGTELWAEVSWTPKAQQKLSERELRYFSPDFSFSWTDPESGVNHRNVLFGGGLTNRPFVKEMSAIVAHENLKGANQMTELEKAQAKITELEASNIKLSESCGDMEKKLQDMPKPDEVELLKKEIEQLKSALQAEKSEKEVYLADKKKLEEAKMLAEKETEFTVLLTEGKACAAQKDSFIKGDMTEFIKLAQPLNLKPAGSSAVDTETDEIQSILKLAEEKRKANPKLGHADSISLAKKELKK